MPLRAALWGICDGMFEGDLSPNALYFVSKKMTRVYPNQIRELFKNVKRVGAKIKYGNEETFYTEHPLVVLLVDDLDILQRFTDTCCVVLCSFEEMHDIRKGFICRNVLVLEKDKLFKHGNEMIERKKAKEFREKQHRDRVEKFLSRPVERSAEAAARQMIDMATAARWDSFAKDRTVKHRDRSNQLSARLIPVTAACFLNEGRFAIQTMTDTYNPNKSVPSAMKRWGVVGPENYNKGGNNPNMLGIVVGVRSMPFEYMGKEIATTVDRQPVYCTAELMVKLSVLRAACTLYFQHFDVDMRVLFVQYISVEKDASLYVSPGVGRDVANFAKAEVMRIGSMLTMDSLRMYRMEIMMLYERKYPRSADPKLFFGIENFEIINKVLGDV